MHVRIAARGVAPERLRALVEKSQRNTPVLSSLEGAVPVTIEIEVGEA